MQNMLRRPLAALMLLSAVSTIGTIASPSEASERPLNASLSRAAAHPALAVASRYIGTNPTKRRTLWCAEFMNFVERKLGRRGTGSALARSFAKYGRAVSRSEARPGDIVVLSRRGGGHVGYLAEPIRGGKVVLISGNSGGGRSGRRVVSKSAYPLGRVIAIRRAH